MSSSDEESNLEKFHCSDGDSPIQELPPELMVPIFKFFDIKGLKNARLVCQRWRCILDHPESKLINFKAEISEANLEHVLNSSLTFDILNVGNFKEFAGSDITKENIFPRTREMILTSGDFNGIFMCTLKNGCDHVEVLNFNLYSLSDVNPIDLSELLTQKKWDCLSDLTFKLEVFNSKSFSQGEELLTWKENYVAVVECFIKSVTAPNLRSFGFYINSDEWEFSSPYIKRILSVFMGFIDRHTKTLRQLSLSIVFPHLSGQRFDSRPTTDSTFPKELQESIGSKLKIENLYLQTNQFEILMQLVPPCIWELNTLTKFSWDPFHVNIYLSDVLGPNPLRDLIQRNRTTLMNANIQFTDHYMAYNSHEVFQLIWLQDCPKLTTLSLDYYRKGVDRIHAQFPSVKELKVSIAYSPEDDSEWVVRTFPNLETIDFRFQPGYLSWFDNLLSLKRLVEIRHRREDSEHLDIFIGLFVNSESGLKLTTGIKGMTGNYGLIKITPAFRLLN